LTRGRVPADHRRCWSPAGTARKVQWIIAGDLEDECSEVSLPRARPWAQMGTDFEFPELLHVLYSIYDVLELPLTLSPSLLQHICSAGTANVVWDDACADA